MNRRLFLAFLIVLGSLAFFPNVVFAWTNASYNYCRNITITNSVGILTNYPVLINLTFAANTNNYLDVAFYNDSCSSTNAVRLSNWQENYTSNVNDYEWVKVDSMPASGTRIISVYYGNTSFVSSSSNITTTFPIFADDFLGSSLGNWTQGGSTVTVSNSIMHMTLSTPAWGDYIRNSGGFPDNIVISIKGRQIMSGGANSNNVQGSAVLGSSASTPSWVFFAVGEGTAGKTYPVFGLGYNIIQGSGTVIENATDAAIFSQDWYHGSMAVSSGHVVYDKLWNDTYSNNFGASSNVNVSGLGVELATTVGEFDVDWITIRPYVTTEPTYSLESQQSLIPIITINSPINTTILTNITYLNFTVKSFISSTFNVSAYDDASNVYLNAAYPNNIAISLQLNKSDGTHNVTVYANDAYSASSSTVYYTIDTTPPVVTISSPVPNGSYSVNVTGTVAFNYNATDATSPPISSCWYNIDNGANTTIASCANTTLNHANFTAIGSHIAYVYANDSVGWVGNTSVTFNVDFTSNFILKNSADNSTINSFSILFQNSTMNYTLSTISGIILANTSMLPWGDVNATFLAYGYNMTTYYYTINSSFIISAVNYENVANLNVQVLNELNINEQLTFNLIMTNGTCNVNGNSISSYSNTWNNLCVGYNTVSISNSSYTYNSVNYTFPLRHYYLTISPYTSLNFTAYLLRIDQGIIFTINIKDYNNNPIPNAVVTASANLNGIYQVIEQETTDSSGNTNFFLDTNTQYQIIVTANNYVNLIFYLTPNAVTHIVYGSLFSMGTTGAALLNLTTIYDDITYSLTPSNYYQIQPFNITYFLSDSAGDLSSWGYSIEWINATNYAQSSNYSYHSTSPFGGTVTYLTPNIGGYYIVNMNFTRNGFNTYNMPSFTYFMNYTNAGFSFITATTFNMWSKGTLELIAIVVTAVAAGFATMFNPLFGGFMAIAVMGIFMAIGFMPWPYFGLMLLLFIGILALKYGGRA